MTTAALTGDNATLDEYLRPGNVSVDTPAIVSESDELCPNQEALPPLQAASCAGHADTVKKLLEKKADPNLATDSGVPPLLLALRHGHEDVVRALISGGAKPDTADRNGDTVLLLAAKQGNMALAAFMLENGASVRTADNQGNTPLMLATSARMAEALLSRGADPLARNKAGDSALHIAARNGNPETTRFFLDHGVRVELRNKAGETSLSLARIGTGVQRERGTRRSVAPAQPAQADPAGRQQVITALEAALRQLVEKEAAAAGKAAASGDFAAALAGYTMAVGYAEGLDDALDQKLRTDLIKYVAQQEAPPALSDASREHLVRIAYMLKHGQGATVEKEMLEILRDDPWWAEGYYNLGVFQAEHEQFARAKRNLAIFISAAPANPKAQMAQDKIYEIKLAEEELGKINGLQGAWVDAAGNRYAVVVRGNDFQITSGGLAFKLTRKNTLLEGSVAGAEYQGAHTCTIPGQAHPVNGKFDADARTINLEYVWSKHDTRYHCVNLLGVPSPCCLFCDEVCDAVVITTTDNVSLRLTSAP